MVEMKGRRIVPEMNKVYRNRKKHVSQGGNWIDPESRTSRKTDNAIEKMARQGMKGEGSLVELPNRLAGNVERRVSVKTRATPGRPSHGKDFEVEHQRLTKEEFDKALPRHLVGTLARSTLERLNDINEDPIIANEIRDNFVSYSVVMSEGKYSVKGYMEAVAYVSYKMMGYTNRQAYEMVFPSRVEKLRQRGVEEKNIAAHVTSYNKGKMVNAILERTLVPTWVLNQDIHQKAINRLAHLMIHAHSEKVQSDSASALIGHLKPPQPKEVNLNIGAREDQGLLDLREALLSLAQKQKDLIGKGVDTRDITEQKLVARRIVEAQYEEVDEED